MEGIGNVVYNLAQVNDHTLCTDMPSAQEIIDYLRTNPDFFEQHEDLLVELSLDDAGGSTLFYERQLQVLKDRLTHHQSKIEFIVDGVRNNQKLESDFLQVAIGLLAQKDSGDSPVQTVNRLMKRQFNVGESVIILKSDATGSGQLRYDAICQRVMHKGSVCDDRLSNALCESIFGQGNQSVQSCTFIPLLFEDELLGVMALGSHSRTRFQPDIGVMFLDRLGLLIGGYIHGRPSQP